MAMHRPPASLETCSIVEAGIEKLVWLITPITEGPVTDA
jgi:hypothetical protein